MRRNGIHKGVYAHRCIQESQCRNVSYSPVIVSYKFYYIPPVCPAYYFWQPYETGPFCTGPILRETCMYLRTIRKGCLICDGENNFSRKIGPVQKRTSFAEGPLGLTYTFIPRKNFPHNLYQKEVLQALLFEKEVLQKGKLALAALRYYTAKSVKTI